jgi:hypothetical protein
MQIDDCEKDLAEHVIPVVVVLVLHDEAVEVLQGHGAN